MNNRRNKIDRENLIISVIAGGMYVTAVGTLCVWVELIKGIAL